MLHNEYELMLIFRPDLEDSDTAALIEKVESIVTDTDGTLLLRDDWGKRKLAYAIKNHLKGHYYLLTFAAPAASIAEIERRLRIDDRIIRFLTVRVDEDVNVAERVEQSKIIQKQRDEEAAARAAAEAEAAAAEAAALEAARAHVEAGGEPATGAAEA